MGAPRTDRGGGKSRWRLLVAALAAFAFLAVQVAPISADPGDQQRLAELERQKQELERAVQVSRANAERWRQQASQFQSAVNAANERIADLAAQQDNAQSQADVLKLQIQITEEQLALVAFQMSDTQALISALMAQGTAQEKQLAQRQEVYSTHLRLTYLQARVSPLEMLLSSSSLSDFVTRVQDLVLIDRQDKQLVNSIRELQDSTTAKQREVVTRFGEIEGLQKQMERQKGLLAEQKKQYEQMVAAIATSIDAQGQVRNQADASRANAQGAKNNADYETAKLNGQLEQVEAMYADLAAQLAAGSGLSVFTGRLVNWPVVGPITSPFGPRWGGFHNGLDIAAPMYTAVRAPAAGVVVTVGKPYLAYGDTATVVIIAHGANFSTLSGHLDDTVHPPPVRVGQHVNSGQIVGYIGMTGWTTGPHDHFMVIVNGRAADPTLYLPAR